MLARMAIKFDNLLLICITLLNMLQIAMTAVVPSTEITTSGTIKYFKWDVEYIFWSPDCQENMVMGINGEFPGPTIRAKAGDQIIVELKNGLHTEGVVIHWHGIRQIGTPWADGTASISQCAINPGETFTYNFTVDKSGTYFYHGHYGMQRAAGLYGMLIVSEKEKEPFHYNEEFDLLLSDWYHNDTMLQSVGLYSKPFRWIGEPQSLLINGRGQYNCSVSASNGWSTCGNKNNQCAPIVLPVHPNKSYRLRIASTTSLASLNLAIQGHYMTVVEADGNYVDPFNVTDMDIYSGESYSVIITTKADASSNYWISVGVRGREPKTQPALAILNYLPNSPSKMPPSPPPITPKWNDYDHSKAFTYKIFAGEDTPKPPADYDHHIALLNTQSVVDGYKKWSINNISLVLPPTPYLAALKYRLSNAFDDHRKPSVEFPNDYNIMIPPVNPNSTQSSSIYRLPFHQTIDVILQNANALNENVSEIHPWHLHGHDFWVLGYGDGKFNRATDIAKFNLKNPPLRNTVVIFPYGWTAIRFVADNPGVWPFHCHIEPHLHMGMGVIFAEGIEQLKDLPKDVIGCGLSAKMSMEHLP